MPHLPHISSKLPMLSPPSPSPHLFWTTSKVLHTTSNECPSKVLSFPKKRLLCYPFLWKLLGGVAETDTDTRRPYVSTDLYYFLSAELSIPTKREAGITHHHPCGFSSCFIKKQQLQVIRIIPSPPLSERTVYIITQGSNSILYSKRRFFSLSLFSEKIPLSARLSQLKSR